MSSTEVEQSFRNLVMFYQKELKGIEKGQKALGLEEISTSTTLCDLSGSVTLAGGPAIDPDNGNRSLSFTGGSDSQVFLLDNVIEKTRGAVLSISMWIRPEPGKEGLQNVISYTNSEQQTDVLKLNQVFLTNDKRVCFGFHKAISFVHVNRTRQDDISKHGEL